VSEQVNEVAPILEEANNGDKKDGKNKKKKNKKKKDKKQNAE